MSLVKSKYKHLTAAQEEFAQQIADGKTAIDALRIAYPNAKESGKRAYRRASEQLNHPKISARIDELKEKLAKRRLWSREISTVHLLKVVHGQNDETSTNTDIINAVKELNKLHNFYKTGQDTSAEFGDLLRNALARVRADFDHNVIDITALQNDSDEPN